MSGLLADLKFALRTLRRTPLFTIVAVLATGLIRLFYGYRYSDLGPFRAIRRDALERLQMTERNYGWTIEMQVRAIEEGLRIIEVPVRYRIRVAGVN